jgi:hypothetical protein
LPSFGRGRGIGGEMTKLVNLTPHPIRLVVGEKELILPPSEQVARVNQGYRDLGTLGLEGVDIPVVATTYGEIIGLPPEEPGVFYITSAIVAQVAWATGCLDVLAPDTGAGAVRDGEGRIVGVTRLLASPDFRLLY